MPQTVGGPRSRNTRSIFSLLVQAKYRLCAEVIKGVRFHHRRNREPSYLFLSGTRTYVKANRIRRPTIRYCIVPSTPIAMNSPRRLAK